MKKDKIQKIISNIIYHRFNSQIHMFNIEEIRDELKERYEINISLDEVHEHIEQHLKRGIIKYRDPDIEPRKNPYDRYYKISIDTDILLWFMKGINYGQKIDERKNIKYNILPRFYPPKISIQYKDK